MNYLSPSTLKIFLYLLYGNESIDIPAALRTENENFIKDIFENKLQEFFTLVRNNEIFKDIDYDNLLDKEYVDFYLINYPLKILLSKIYKDKLIAFIGEYINNFESGDLDSVTDHYYPFNESLSKAARKLNSFSEGINKEFSIKIPLKEDPQNRFYEKEVRFFETVFYLNIKKIISINSCNIIKDFEYQEQEKQKLDLNLTFKKDISSIKGILTEVLKEDINQDKEVIYEISYYDFSRDIFINDRKLKTLRYNSPNRIVFEYLYSHPDEDIEKETLNDIVYKELNKPLEKKLSKIAQEAGFTGNRKKLFFITTENTAKLRIQITKKQIDKAKIDPSKILP